MPRLLVVWIIPYLACGAVTNVTVQTTFRQALISYTAPDPAGCAVDVYQDAGRTQEVNDTNPAIFGAGANQDNRAGSLSSGRRRDFVVGQIPLPGWSGYSPAETTQIPLSISTVSRALNIAAVTTSATHGLRVYDHVAMAGVGDATFDAVDALVLSTPSTTSFTYTNTGTDGSSSGGTTTRVNRFSRALQTATQHWFHIACGADTYDGTFLTANIPLGNTYGELTPFDWSSAPMKYLYPAIPNVRPYTVIDPTTGIAAHRGSSTADCTTCAADYPTSFDAGSMVACPQQKTNGGYHCTVESKQASNRLYWYGDDGSVRYLGQLRYSGGTGWATGYTGPQAFWDTNNPNLFWAIGSNTLLALNYTGNDVAVSPNAYVSWTATDMIPAATGKTLTSMIQTFDATFSGTTYSSCGIASVQGDYLTGVCRSFDQDSPAWLWALYLGDRLPLGACSNCLQIAAATPMFANPKTRWCGEHYSDQLPVFNVMPFVVQHLVGGGATGPWQVSLTNAVASTDTSWVVSGEPVCNASSLPTNGSTYLQDAAVGDVFLIGSEWVKLTGKTDAQHWTVSRGYGGTTKASYAAATLMRAGCEPIEITAGPPDDFFWRYLSDPHGTDTTNVYWIQDTGMYNAHRVERDPWDIMAGWDIRYGSFPANNFNGAVTTTISPDPAFSGIRAGADGNSYQKHNSFENWNSAEASRQAWFIDLLPFQVDPTSGLNVFSKISGTTYIYKVAPSTTWPVDVKRMPMLGISGLSVLLDVSGPSSALSDTSGDAYKFCVVYKPGECWAGSSAGAAYANLPSSPQTCGAGASEGFTGQSDFCALNVSPYGQAVVQLGLDGKSHRALIRGLAGMWRVWETLTNARTTPDGHWLLFPTNIDSNATTNDGESTMVAAVPDTPAWESTNRTDFVPVTVSLGGLARATETVIEFGYAPDGNYRCTQRAETCVAAASTYNPTTPYYFANADTYTGVDCSAGCSIVIPAISGRVMYWRVKYRGAGANAIAVTQPQIVTIP
ncbi:MAG: hypothetical protein ACLQGV_21770 [Bryobacteraceae bacterium]